MRDFRTDKSGASHDDHLAARSQRWWYDGSGAGTNAKLAARGQLQRCREAC